jgi:hypothetical protein
MNRFWRFVPAVSRPWNPAYREVWDSMSHRERQKSFLIDLAVVLVVLIGLLALSGCNQPEQADDPYVRNTYLRKTCDHGRAIYHQTRGGVAVVENASECKP